jgi:hypothetical protein
MSDATYKLAMLKSLHDRATRAKDLISIVNEPVIGSVSPDTAYALGRGFAELETIKALLGRDIDEMERREGLLSAPNPRRPRRPFLETLAEQRARNEIADQSDDTEETPHGDH